MSQEIVGPLTVTSPQGAQGGSLELGATVGAAPDTPYLDFHFGLGAAQDYNVRLINTADNHLDVVTEAGGPVWSIHADKIGIGTTTPAAKLVVHEPAGGAELRVEGHSGTYGLSLGADAPQPWVGTRTNHALRLLTNNTEKMRIQANGHVGIGNATPDHVLVVGPPSGGRHLVVNDIPTARWGLATGNGNLAMQNDGSGTWETRLLLTKNGNVGIGTNTPQEKLDVNGRVKSGALSLGAWPANANGVYMYVGVNTLDQSQAGNYALLQQATGNVIGTTFLNSPADIHFRIGNNEKMVLEHDGDLTIVPGRLNFGAQVRQMINLWNTSYGIGIQAGTQYYRTDGQFAWFLGGVHNDAASNPGGGRRLMVLNAAGDLVLSARTNPSANPNGPHCRALVDWGNMLIINFAGDYTAGVQIASNLHVTGNAVKPGGGSWGVASDIRRKQNVQPLAGALDKLLRLRGVFFEWKEPEQQGNLTGPQRGLIADEVEEVFPEWISTDPEGYKQLTVRGFEALVVEAFRTLKAENDHIKEQNQALETRVVELEAKLQASGSANGVHKDGVVR